MLTGDKLETAMCIGISTDLKPKGYEYFRIDYSSIEKIQFSLNRFNPHN